MGMESLRDLKSKREELLDNTLISWVSRLKAPTNSITIFPPPLCSNAVAVVVLALLTDASALQINGRCCCCGIDDESGNKWGLGTHSPTFNLGNSASTDVIATMFWIVDYCIVQSKEITKLPPHPHLHPNTKTFYFTVCG